MDMKCFHTRVFSPPGADQQHLSGRVGEAAEGKALQATTSGWVNAHLRKSPSACKRLTAMLIFAVQKPQRDSPVTMRPRNSSTRPATTLTSPASVSSQWPTISVTSANPLSFYENDFVLFNWILCLQAPSWPRPKRTSLRGRSWLSLFSTSKRFPPISSSSIWELRQHFQPLCFLRLFLMRIIDIPYLNITGPDRKWQTDPRRAFFQSQQLTFVLFLQCNLKETTFCTSPSQKNGRPVTSTSCLVPLVEHLLKPVTLLFYPRTLEFLSVNFWKTLLRKHPGFLDRRHVGIRVPQSDRPGPDRWVWRSGWIGDLFDCWRSTFAFLSDEHQPLRRELQDPDVRRVRPE